MPLVALIAISVGVIAALWFQQWSAQAGPVRTSRMLRNVALLGGGLFLMFLLLRSAPAVLALLGLFSPLLIRILQRWGRMRPAASYHDFKSSSNTSGQEKDDRQSAIETRFLRVTLYHSSGLMQGEILEGAFAGRQLGDLGFPQLLELWHECQNDTQSAAVLEAYLDRTQAPDWRDQVRATHHQDEGGQAGAGAGGIAMEVQEAYAILGLQPGASKDEIRSAHKRLMQKFHPDLGGTDYLATRINQAKKLLLQG